MAVRSAVFAWCGLAVVAASGLLAGCGGESKPVTSENSKYRPSDTAKAEAEVGLPPVDVPQGLPAQQSKELEQSSDPTSVKSPAAKPRENETAKSNAKEPQENPAGTNAPPSKTSKEIVVSGEVNQLMKTIEQLISTEPRGNTREEKVGSFVKQMHFVVELSSRLLQANSGPEVDQFALTHASQALQALQELGDPSARTRMTTFANVVAKHPNADIARNGRLMLFDANMASQLDTEKVDAPAVLKEVEQLLATDAGDQQVLVLAASVSQMLDQRGHRDEAVKGLRAVAAAYKDHKDEKLAELGSMQEHAANLIELDAKSLLKNVLDKKPDADAKLLTAMQGLLKEKNPSPAYIQASIDIIQQLERNGNDALVMQFYDLLDASFGAHENPEISKAITKYVANGRKRYALVGKPFAIEAVSFESVDTKGKPLDLKSLQGKVLLVNCWGTFVGPALREMPTLRQLSEKLQPKGLEVISLILDIDLQQPERLFQYQKNFIPWTSYVSPDVAEGKKFDKEAFAETSLAQELGLFALPFYILVDKDGKVDSIYHYKLDSERMGLRLKELLGLPEAPKFTLDPPPPLTIDNPTIPKAIPIPNDAPPQAAAPPVEPPKPESPAVPAPAPPAKPDGKQGRALPDLRQLDRQLAAVFSPASLFSVLAAEDEPAKAEPAAEANPYLAKPGLSSSQLTDWVFKMLDKPKTIQGRPGFSAAIVEACDRVLADKGAKDTEQLVAIENKLSVLHRAACNGDEKADKQLAEFVAKLKDDARPRVARETAFFKQERKVLDASEAKPEELTALLKDLQEYYAKEKLASKHLRMASATVDLINKLEDGDAREKHFSEFGQVFAKSSDKELARYGKKLAKKPETKESDLVGKPLELVGNTAGGLPFAWEKYRGKVVIVDFWATWCGPCRKEMPNVKALREKHKDKGLEIVGVSVDKDLEALDTYLDENDIPWETLAGDEASALAEKYGVRGIPTMMLVDQQGNVVAVAHNVAALAPQAEKLLAK